MITLSYEQMDYLAEYIKHEMLDHGAAAADIDADMIESALTAFESVSADTTTQANAWPFPPALI
jgi:hypothetical protein